MKTKDGSRLDPVYRERMDVGHTYRWFFAEHEVTIARNTTGAGYRVVRRDMVTGEVKRDWHGKFTEARAMFYVYAGVVSKPRSIASKPG